MSSILAPRKQSLMNVVIRADAGPAVGTGHVMRMMALADSCCQLGGRVTMLCGDIPRGLVQRLICRGIDVQQLKSATCDQADAFETVALAKQLDADWIVLDGYRFDSRYQQTVSSKDAVLMMMDDGTLADRSIVDVVLNQNVYASNEEQSDRFLGGCQFTLLRSEFLSQAAVEPKHIRKSPKRILVTLGGCDDANWTSRVLNSIPFSNAQKLSVDVVVGAGYRHLESLQELTRRLPFSIRIHQNVDRMVDLMQQVDLAVTAGGSTCYELARCGVPAIAIPVAPNQELVVAALADRGSLIAFEPEEDFTQCNDRLTSAIKSLINDAAGRSQMSQIGRELVDGKGALRIARSMANWGLNFRNAELDDAPQLLAWRNDPEVRSVSFHSKVMDKQSYYLWLEEQIARADRSLWLVESHRGEAIGTVDVEMQNDRQAVIELTLDHTRRGKGLGRAVIQKVCEMTFAENPQLDSVIARICPGNIASERAFCSVGFKQTQPTMIDKKLVFQFVLHRSNQNTARRAA